MPSTPCRSAAAADGENGDSLAARAYSDWAHLPMTSGRTDRETSPRSVRTSFSTLPPFALRSRISQSMYRGSSARDSTTSSESANLSSSLCSRPAKTVVKPRRASARSTAGFLRLALMGCVTPAATLADCTSRSATVL